MMGFLLLFFYIILVSFTICEDSLYITFVRLYLNLREWHQSAASAHSVLCLSHIITKEKSLAVISRLCFMGSAVIMANNQTVKIHRNGWSRTLNTSLLCALNHNTVSSSMNCGVKVASAQNAVETQQQLNTSFSLMWGGRCHSVNLNFLCLVIKLFSK